VEIQSILILSEIIGYYMFLTVTWTKCGREQYIQPYGFCSFLGQYTATLWSVSFFVIIFALNEVNNI